MRIGITFKIGAFATLLVCITAFCTGYFMYWQAGKIITNHELVDLSDETRLKGAKLVDVIDTLREDVLYLAGLNEIDALVRARTPKVDPVTSELIYSVSPETESELRASLQTRFKEICRINRGAGTSFEGKSSEFKPYFQVRFIGKLRLNDNEFEEGREIVRVYRELKDPPAVGELASEAIRPADATQSAVVTQYVDVPLPDFKDPTVVFHHVADEELDEPNETKYSKADETYFNEPQHHKEANVHLSAVNLNREDSKITNRRMQVLRGSAPVYDDGGNFFGIIVINLDFGAAARAIRNSPRSLEYVMDENQQFLVHPDPQLAFLWDHEVADRLDPVEKKKAADEHKRHDDARDAFYFSLHATRATTETPKEEATDAATNATTDADSKATSPTPSKLISFNHGNVEKAGNSVLVGDKRNKEKPILLDEGFHMSTFNIGIATLKDVAFAENFGKPFQKFITNHNRDASPDKNDWRGRIRSTVDAKKGIVQLSCLDESVLDGLRSEIEASPAFGDKLEFSSSVACRQFAIHYYRFPYHPDDSTRFFDLAMVASYEEFDSDVDLVGRLILYVSLALIVVAAVLAFLFSLVLTRPLRQMTTAVEGFTNDSTEISLPLNARDEIGVLANAFREMFRQIRKRTAELRRSTEKLDQRVNRRTSELRHRTEELQRKTEQLAEANGYKTDGLRGIAHELRAPLTGIDAAIRFLKSDHGGSLTDENLIRVARIGRSCEHVQKIVDNLGQIARYESGRLELHKSQVVVSQFLNDAVGMLAELFQKKDLKVGIDEDPALKSISCDEGRARQVLINLLSNAQKYTPAGGSVTVKAEQVEVSFSAERQSEQHLKISVSDTGAGIPAEDLPKVFNDFHRAKNTMQTAKGLGLGLALARRLVEMHWGTVGIDSQLGEGTTAWFTLPCDDIERQTATTESDTTESVTTESVTTESVTTESDTTDQSPP